MPNAKVLSEKQAIVANLTEKVQAAAAGVIVDYKGITVAEDTALRAECRQNNIEYAVVKNTLTRFAANELGYTELDPLLNGTTALALGMEDPIVPAKHIVDFAKKNPKVFAVKGGFFEGKFMNAEEIEAISELGSKQGLLSTVLGTMNAPIAAFARVINAIAEQKGGAAE